MTLGPVEREREGRTRFRLGGELFHVPSRRWEGRTGETFPSFFGRKGKKRKGVMADAVGGGGEELPFLLST